MHIFQGISFDVLARQQTYLDALNLAIERAKQKADAIALKSGRSVGKVLEISEDGSSSSTYTTSYTNYQSLSSYEALSYARDRSAAISEGQVEISASVNIIYKLD